MSPPIPDLAQNAPCHEKGQSTRGYIIIREGTVNFIEHVEGTTVAGDDVSALDEGGVLEEAVVDAFLQLIDAGIVSAADALYRDLC